MTTTGTRNLITDIDGISVGNAHKKSVKTGATVILASEPAIAAVCVAGGGPGTRETDLLGSGMMVDKVDAIVLSGGSAYGLATADGVVAALGAEGRGFGLSNDPNVPQTPIVPAAILYDLANGGDKNWGKNPPYFALGQHAISNVANEFDLGISGAAFGAHAGTKIGGLGSASTVSNDGITVGAIVAVNSFGSVYMPGTDCFWAWPYEVDSEFGGVQPPTDYNLEAEDWGEAKINPKTRENTTIACVATDVTLSKDQAKRVAQMALAGFARSIRPVFAPFDGDTVFVLSTARIPLPTPEAVSVTRIGELAAATLCRSIARGVWEANS